MSYHLAEQIAVLGSLLAVLVLAATLAAAAFYEAVARARVARVAAHFYEPTCIPSPRPVANDNAPDRRLPQPIVGWPIM